MTVRVVVFDLDDTLYLERDFVKSGLHAAAAILPDPADRSRFFDVAWQLFSAGERLRVIDRTLELLEMPDKAELSSSLIEEYRTHRPSIELPPDATVALTRARHEFEGVAVLTDGWTVTQRQKIASLGLEAKCDLIVVTDEHGGRDAWKPNPKCYRLIEQHFALDGDAFVYVADNPFKDFVAPRALAWKSIRVARPGGLHSTVAMDGEVDAERRITSLDDLGLRSIRTYLDG